MSLNDDPWMVDPDLARILRQDDKFGPIEEHCDLTICPVHGLGCPVWEESV